MYAVPAVRGRGSRDAPWTFLHSFRGSNFGPQHWGIRCYGSLPGPRSQVEARTKVERGAGLLKDKCTCSFWWWFGVVIFFFPYNPPPPDKPPGRPTPESLISVHFGCVSVRFGSVSGLFRVRFGSVLGCRVGSEWGRGKGLQ